MKKLLQKLLQFLNLKNSDRSSYLPDRLPCLYCGTQVSKDFIIAYRYGNFSDVVCGKKECLQLYTDQYGELAPIK